MLIQELLTYLDAIAPRLVQEDYDNSGLQCGNAGDEVGSALIALDVTPAIVQEAIDRDCGLIISHHPLIFKPLKRITGGNAVERSIELAIRNGVAIYAMHTNLDNVSLGVNKRICEKIGLKASRIISPKRNLLKKLITFVSKDHADAVRNAIFDAGGGVIGRYDMCSFNAEGFGTFRGDDSSTPFVGNKGTMNREPEIRIETVVPAWLEDKVVQALLEAHPYEEVAYDLIPLANEHPRVGSGMIGEFEDPMDARAFLAHLKSSMDLHVIKHTATTADPISKVAVCGGAGSFLLMDAINAGAHAFVSADFTYHRFFEAEQQILIADIGHYESERFTMTLIQDLLRDKFPNFAALLTELNTNPVHYFS